ncbi:sigma-54-dependent Fis family transcriptional regulator [Alteribacillus sp. HJP-4]|uniref:sigma-54-dependent Fis family transcriptional regulator n=1 Tax=Alteribacillus sp. HJP-4 TaxID=2775394 RepID=UPI0035CCDF93
MNEQVTKENWRRFVREGALDSSRMNKRIASSWFHCRKRGVDPYNGKGTMLLEQSALEKRRENNHRLLSLAEPFMEKLSSMYAETSVILLLIDREGYVLRMLGQAKAKAYAESINFMEGVKWTEEQVGTNAIGTALSIGEPITVNGPEHFSVASQSWGCSASPIRDENGEILGVLDISSQYAPGYHEHLLGTVVSAAYAIEHKYKQMMKDEEVALLNYVLKEKVKNSSPFLLCNRNHRVVYFSPYLEDRLDIKLNDKLGKNIDVACKNPIYSEYQKDVIGYWIPYQQAPALSNWSGWRKSLHYQGVSGPSKVFQAVLEKAARAVHSEVTIHIAGATGTGKEVMARSIHESTSPGAPFVAINCGAVPENLLESELFGYEAGAFTGARKYGYDGKVQQADGGTLFLDEIGDISPSMQVVLLRVLQEKHVVPVGGTKPVPVSFRLMTASNRSLGELVKEGTFREDLYYRIYVYPLQLPSLQERREDIPALVDYYFEKKGWEAVWKKEAVLALQSYHWPGNIRELFNALEGLHAEYRGESPSPHRVLNHVQNLSPFEDARETKVQFSPREQMEKDYIEKALRQHGGRASPAAEQLGIPRSSFYRKLKKYDLN